MERLAVRSSAPMSPIDQNKPPSLVQVEFVTKRRDISQTRRGQRMPFAYNLRFGVRFESRRFAQIVRAKFPLGYARIGIVVPHRWRRVSTPRNLQRRFPALTWKPPRRLEGKVEVDDS